MQKLRVRDYEERKLNLLLLAREVVLVKREKEGEFNDHSGGHQSWGSWESLLSAYPRLVVESQEILSTL